MRRNLTILIVLALALISVLWLAPVKAGAAPSAASAALQGIRDLTAAQTACLTTGNAEALAKAPAGLSVAQVQTQLHSADLKFVKPGGVCGPSPKGPTAPGASKALAKAVYSNGFGGPYTNWWNINGYTASAWLDTHWVGYAYYSVQYPNSPVCFPGSTAPTFSVSVTGCWESTPNGNLYYTQVHISFEVTETVAWVTISSAHAYWENDFINGVVNTGCSIGC